MAREDWKAGDVLVKRWGKNAGEKRTIARRFECLSLDDGIVLGFVFEGYGPIYHQPDLIKQGWALLKEPSNANDQR